MPVDGIVGAKHLLTRMGTPYEERDCIEAVVVDVIRSCPGGVKDYRIGGCTALWNSINKSGKYKDITEILTIADCECNGFLIGDILAIYDAKTKTCEHVAYYMGGIGGYEAVHSSATVGCLCGTKVRNGFTHVLRHRYIKGAVLQTTEEETEMTALYKKQVQLDSGHLNLRNGPSADSRDIGDIPNGAIVEVLVEGNWPFVRYNGKTGYVSGKYLFDPPEEELLVEEEAEDYTKWGVFIPCENQEHAEMLASFFNVRVVCQREVID